MMARRRVVIGLCIGLVIGLASCGTVHTGPTRRERGEALRTERDRDVEAVYSLICVRGPVVDPDLSPELLRRARRAAPGEERPYLAAWVQKAVRTVERSRPVYALVEVTPRNRVGFTPEFFLWPLNLVRTPLGIIGCAFSGVRWGLHKGALVVGVPVGGLAGLAGALVVPIIGGSKNDVMGWAGAGLRGTVAVIETFLLPVDLIHKALHGTPLYPVFTEGLSRESELDTRTREAIGRSWRFAWAYRTYPPLPVWRKDVENRKPLPGMTERGDWTETVEDGRPEALPDPDLYLVTAAGCTKLETRDGTAVIILEELAGSLGVIDALEFRIEAETPDGLLSREFSFGRRYWTPGDRKAPTSAPERGTR